MKSNHDPTTKTIKPQHQEGAQRLSDNKGIVLSRAAQNLRYFEGKDAVERRDSRHAGRSLRY